MVGWGDTMREYSHFMAPSGNLRLVRFSVKLKLQDRAECGNDPLLGIEDPVTYAPMFSVVQISTG